MKISMPKLSTLAAMAALGFSSSLWALNVGESLPAVASDAPLEEIRIENDKPSYKAVELGELKGKVFTIYHLAPRMGIDELHKPYFDALKAANFPTERYQTITVANMDEAMWGTSGMVKSKFEENAKTSPDARFILDDDSSLRDAWGLTKKTAVIILIDTQGKVLAVKEGEVKPEEVEPLLALIKSRI